MSSGAIPVLGFVVSQGAELLRRGVLSIDYPVDKLVVVQMGDNPAVSSVIAELLLLAEQDPSRHPHLATLRVAKLGNLGCAAGWNRIILEDLFAPYWLILNFDIAFPPGALRRVHANASDIFAAHERIGMIHLWYQWGGYKPEWSAFMLRRETVHDIGFFDENNWPVRHEDFDYSIRMIGTPFRKPWYRHLLPHRHDENNQCPDLYVFHGVGGSLWGGGTERVNDEAGKRPGECKAISDEYRNWQFRRGQAAFSPNKWGDNGGPKVGNDCHDPKMLAKVKDIRGTAHWQHPTGADYYPPGVMWVPFSRPFGHPGMPVWFWVLDPHVRRCILGARQQQQQQQQQQQRRRQRRRRLGGGGGGKVQQHHSGRGSLPPTCRASNIPYYFDKLKGLPDKCIDALDLCVSSLTSLQDSPTLERLGLIPRDRKANCEASSRKLALPPPMEALLGPEKYGCPTSGPPKGRPITDRAGNRVSTKIPSGPVPDGPVLPLDAGDNHSLSLDDLLKAKQKQKQKQAALTSGR